MKKIGFVFISLVYLNIVYLFFLANLFSTKLYALDSSSGIVTSKDSTSAPYYSPSGYNWIADRRQPQSGPETQVPGYFFLVLPSAIPGQGTSLSFIGLYNNIGGSPVSDFFVANSGATSQILLNGLTGIPLYKDYLSLDTLVAYSGKLTATYYTDRGMENNQGNYLKTELNKAYFYGARLRLDFWEKRLELYQNFYHFYGSIHSLQDQNGKDLLNSQKDITVSGDTRQTGIILDLTDDNDDPRRGFNLGLLTGNNRNGGGDNPSYNTYNVNVTGYVPIWDKSTWVFNGYTSFNDVYHQGSTDREALAQKKGLVCDATNTICNQYVRQYLDNQVAYDRYGNASAQGGSSRLRGFPTGRFQAANVQFVGTEFRWNFLNDKKPFDWYFTKDVRTNMQLALFYEMASVEDERSQLWKHYAYDYGLGIRIVTASGLVYRVEYAWGQSPAGSSTGFTAFVGYPWSNSQF